MAKLFKLALDERRASFIDFFLRINYDPRQTFHQVEQERYPRNARKDISVGIASDQTDNVTPTPREMAVEYQNQLQLDERGLNLVFQLYKKALGSNAQVSRFCTIFT